MKKVGNALDRAVEAALRIIDPKYARLCERAEALRGAGPYDPKRELAELAERAKTWTLTGEYPSREETDQ